MVLIMRDPPGDEPTDTDDPTDEASESMRRATERLRRLWAEMNRDGGPPLESEESKAEDVK
jgi:hypothetical protein